MESACNGLEVEDWETIDEFQVSVLKYYYSLEARDKRNLRRLPFQGKNVDPIN